MEKFRRVVNEIAYTRDLSKLSTIKHSLIPLLSLASSLYKLSLHIRYHLYRIGLFQKHRLPVPVVSVGNLTWGGNGKTPMVEFLSGWFAHSGISPLILSRGYAGGDEVKMLQRHLLGTSARIGVGANRAKTAICYLERYGHVDPHINSWFGNCYSEEKLGDHFDSSKFGVVVLDDGMQHLSLSRDVEIVMINGLMPWGNHQLLPFGPLREPLTALQRADVVVVHHADLLGPLCVDRVDFSDHHLLQDKDVAIIKVKALELVSRFGLKPIVIVTEKDYDRDPEVLLQLCPFDVLVLCSQLEFLPHEGCSEDSFKKLLKQHLVVRSPSS